MRIIGGRIRGRKLLAPGKRFGDLIRPTSDRAREALFNILGRKVAGARVLDLFAGTGALGLEALSRGAAEVVFVDGNHEAAALIERNVAACGFAGQATVLRRDLTTGLAFLSPLKPANGFDLVFLDPPYGVRIGQRLLEVLSGEKLLSPTAVVILEDRAGEECPEQAGNLLCFDRRRYGEAGFWLYGMEEAENGEGRP